MHTLWLWLVIITRNVLAHFSRPQFGFDLFYVTNHQDCTTKFHILFTQVDIRRLTSNWPKSFDSIAASVIQTTRRCEIASEAHCGRMFHQQHTTHQTIENSFSENELISATEKFVEKQFFDDFTIHSWTSKFINHVTNAEYLYFVCHSVNTPKWQRPQTNVYFRTN